MKIRKLRHGGFMLEDMIIESRTVSSLSLRAYTGEKIDVLIDHRTLVVDRGVKPIDGVAVGDHVRILKLKLGNYADAIQVVAVNEDQACEFMVGRRSPISSQIERSP